MRILVLLRGTPGCGKSTWIEKKGLLPYTLCADTIRLLYRSPIIDKDGKWNIDQSVNKQAWATLFDILEYRMSKGEFTVIDACNSKTSEMNLYKSLAEKYRYRMFCVDFTDIPIEQAKIWNKQRPEIKQVPESAIDLYYSRFATQKIPSGIKVITRDDFEKETDYRSVDLSEYNKVCVIGDIHGCYTVLNELIDEIKDDTYYIFTGDYIDRGIENDKIIEFLLSIKDKPNVCLLEGNHEKWLWAYANDEPVRSKEFILNTQKQIESFDKKDLRVLYRKLRQCIFFEYDRQCYFVTHAGVSGLHNKGLAYIPTDCFINGVGNYGDIYDCQVAFAEGRNVIQIHGHRNPQHLGIVQGSAYNLEGRVEFGGCLRAVEITHDGIKPIEIENKVFKEQVDESEQSAVLNDGKVVDNVVDIANLVVALRNSKKDIIEKKFDNISSFNFSRNVFYDKTWNNITTKARGLFINTDNYTIAARAYNKFFNIGETKETELAKLSSTLQFPVNCYLKYNGFLGILGYDEKNDKLLFCSKSNIGGEFSKYFENIFMAKYSSIYDDVLNYVKVNNTSLVFEVIDKDNDPHIIKANENEIVLLDDIKRDLFCSKLEYEGLVELGKHFGFKVKEKAYTLNTWGEFLAWYNEVTDHDYKYNGQFVEGFVIVDQNNFMTKLKGAYYNFWKFMRNVADETMRVSKNGTRQGYIRRTSALTTPLANEFYGYLRMLCEQGYDGKTDIVSLRDGFYDYIAKNHL